jgi:hypothetical protein
MRLLFGIVLGIFLTIGAAYLYDSAPARSDAAAAPARQMVNWDVVGHNLQVLQARALAEWRRLTAG